MTMVALREVHMAAKLLTKPHIGVALADGVMLVRACLAAGDCCKASQQEVGQKGFERYWSAGRPHAGTLLNSGAAAAASQRLVMEGRRIGRLVFPQTLAVDVDQIVTRKKIGDGNHALYRGWVLTVDC